MRVHGLDNPHDVVIPTAVEPWLSGARPYPNYSSYGVVRPEWTKAHAFTKDAPDGGARTNITKLQQTFPDTFRDGYPSDSNRDAAVAALNGHDPHRVFSNSYRDMLFPG